MAGSDCSAATCSGANGASRLTYGSGEPSTTRNVSAYVAGASETVTATQRPSGDHAAPPSAAGVATSDRVLPVATSTTDTSARTQSSPDGEGECEKAIAAPSGDQSNAGPLIPAPTCPPTCTSCGVSSRATLPLPVASPATSIV